MTQTATPMKDHDVAALLWRAAAAMETPADLNEDDRAALLDELIEAARALETEVGAKR